MNFQDVKIGNKLLIGFSSMVLIAIFIGGVGYRGMKTIESQHDEVALVRLPSVRALLIISEAQTAVDAAENVLLAQGITPEIRRLAYGRFDAAKQRADKAWEIYAALPQTDEEARVWTEFVPAWENWWSHHEQYVELARKYEADTAPASYKAMSDFALVTIAGPFAKAERLINQLVEINDQVAHRSNELAEEEARDATILLLSIVLLGVLVSAVLGASISRSITQPLAKGVRFAEAVAAGDLLVNIDIQQKDEIGLLSNALKRMVETLKRILSEISNGAENLSSASQQISSTAQQMSQGASEQAASVEELSSTMEQMSSNILQNTGNSQQTDKIATRASGEIVQGGKAVSETVVSMKTIAQKVSVISEIAFQTNILALNAAVEAARAGEQGRGFAVVAAEVRKLAERSQRAAKEIGELTKASAQIAERTGKLFVEIVPSIQDTARLVQEITASSIQQSSGANQANLAIQQLNQVSQQNAAASEQLATSAEEMASQAEQLQDIVSYFKVDAKMKHHQAKLELVEAD